MKKCEFLSYKMAMPQCEDDASAAFPNSDKPAKDITGTIVRGLTKRRIIPIIPVK